jgi:hypothetical protein
MNQRLIYLSPLLSPRFLLPNLCVQIIAHALLRAASALDAWFSSFQHP